MSNKTIAIGSDHAGFELKGDIIVSLIETGYEVIDCGPDTGESVDYPDFAHEVAKEVEANNADLGILICGSGNGVCMTANSHKGIRAGLAWLPEIAELARQHNNANVICIPARFVSPEDGLAIALAFLNSEFEGGRHQRRADKIKG
jgi:ribose 5-phosphate isomerase B